MFTIQVASLSILFIQLHVICLIFQVLLTTIRWFFGIRVVHLSIMIFVVWTRKWLLCYLMRMSMNFAYPAAFKQYNSWAKPFWKRSTSSSSLSQTFLAKHSIHIDIRELKQRRRRRRGRRLVKNVFIFHKRNSRLFRSVQYANGS